MFRSLPYAQEKPPVQTNKGVFPSHPKHATRPLEGAAEGRHGMLPPSRTGAVEVLLERSQGRLKQQRSRNRSLSLPAMSNFV